MRKYSKSRSRSRSNSHRSSRSRSKSPQQENNDKIDYNALDYEENNDQSDKEDRNDKKIELVSYPPLGSFKPDNEDHDQNNHNLVSEESKDLILNKRSEVLAMALGVQIKTGEDPPTGDISISGYEKKKKLQERFQKDNNDLNDDLKGPRSEVHMKKIPDNLDEKLKPVQNNAHREQHDFKRINYEKRDDDFRRRDRRFEPRRWSPDRGFRGNRYFNP